MKYALQIGEVPIYNRDENGEIIYEHYEDSDGNIIYYLDENGNKTPSETGEYEIGYSEPVSFLANISNKLNKVVWAEYGIDNSTNYAQILADKDILLLKAGSVIWKKSEVGRKESGSIDDSPADYVVKGVADEGQDFDLFLLQRNLK